MNAMTSVLPEPLLDSYRRLRRIAGTISGRHPRVSLDARLRTLRVGSSYGGWVICPDLLDEDSIIYCVGIGTDVTFDVGLIEQLGCRVSAMDPTPTSLEWVRAQSLPAKLDVIECGLAAHDGVLTLFEPSDPSHVSHSVFETRAGVESVDVPVARLSTLMDQLGHDHVDLLKMDIEGAEYDVIDDIVGSGIVVGQVLVEFHHFRDEIPVDKTSRAISSLRDAGYRLFSISASGYEYSFVHESKLTSVR